MEIHDKTLKQTSITLLSSNEKNKTIHKNSKTMEFYRAIAVYEALSGSVSRNHSTLFSEC